MGGFLLRPEEASVSTQPGRRRKRFLAPQEKYEIWMQLVRGETTVGDAADAEMAVRLTLAEGKPLGAEWPSPKPGRRGHQGGVVDSG